MTKYKTIYSEVSGDQLQEEISRIAGDAVADIIKNGSWESSNETTSLENEANKIQRKVMEGRGKLIDFHEACEKWKKAGTEGANR